MYVCMYVCMHACMYVRTYVCVCVCLYVCLSVCLCLCVCMSVCMYVCLSVCMYVCMSACVCMHVSINVYIYICKCMCIYICLYTYIHVCVICTIYYTYIYMCVCSYTYDLYMFIQYTYLNFDLTGCISQHSQWNQNSDFPSTQNLHKKNSIRPTNHVQTSFFIRASKSPLSWWISLDSVGHHFFMVHTWRSVATHRQLQEEVPPGSGEEWKDGIGIGGIGIFKGKIWG